MWLDMEIIARFFGRQSGIFSSLGLGDAPRARRDGCGLSARQGKRRHASIFGYLVPRSFHQTGAIRRPFRTHELVRTYHQPLRSWLMSAVASRLIPFYPIPPARKIVIHVFAARDSKQAGCIPPSDWLKLHIDVQLRGGGFGWWRFRRCDWVSPFRSAGRQPGQAGRLCYPVLAGSTVKDPGQSVSIKIASAKPFARRGWL